MAMEAHVLLLSVSLLLVGTFSNAYVPVKAPAHAPVKPPAVAPVQYPVKPPKHSPVTPPIHSPKKPPTYPPVKPPTHPPVKPPVHGPVLPPKKSPAPAPAKPPVHVPVKAPVQPPLPPVYSLGCIPKCAEYCKAKQEKEKHFKLRPCMKACTTCCTKYKCVPIPGPKKCKPWDHVKLDSKITIKCP